MKIDLTLLSEKRREIYRFYKLDFLEDGTPVKKTENGLVFHPILPAYLINDYLLVYENTKNDDALSYAKWIAFKSFSKAELHENTLVYWYYPHTKLSSIPIKFYSALTQAWYVKAACRLSEYDEQFNNYTYKFFNSLKVPIDKEGVLLQKDFGWVVEEYPFEPPLYTLNGWLTVLRILIDSSKYINTIKGYDEFLQNNLMAVKHLLPKYDAGFVFNSRYNLSGFTRFRFVFPESVKFETESFSILIPGEGEYEGALSKGDLSRWSNYVERKEGRLLQFNIMLSLVAHPECNILKSNLFVDQDCKVRCFMADGDYDPFSSGMPTQRWREIAPLDLREGNNNISIALDYDDKNMFAYPTNFKKDIHLGKGKLYNAYHFIHITDLAVLYEYTKENLFLDYLNKWILYLDEWPKLEFLPASKYSYEHHLGNDSFRQNLNLILKSAKAKGAVYESM